MQDKTTIGNNENAKTPSKTFHEYINTLVEEIVINNAVFDDQKKYLQRYCQEENLDYASFEKNLTDLFEAFKDLKLYNSNTLVLLVKKLAKDCYLEESTVDNLISTINKAKEEAKRKAEEKAKREAEEAKLKAEEEARRKAEEEAERKAEEEAQRKAEEEAIRKAEEEAKRKAEEEAKRKAEEARRKAEEAERKTRNEKLLKEHPFIDFPNVRKELMNCIGFEDFYGKYYLGYESRLKEIRLIVLRLVDLLKDPDVKQSDEYLDFESTANLYLSKTPNSSCSEICQEYGSIKENGEALVRKGRDMGNTVRENREKAAFKKLVRNRTWIAAIITFVTVSIACLIAWWRIYHPDYSIDGWPEIAKVLGVLFLVFCLILFFLIPFFWSKDFRKTK